MSSYDERKLCVVCAWRGTCQLKYSMPGGVALHCTEFTRDVTLKEPEEEIRKRNILLIGPREIGKTTLLRNVADRAGLRADGYYTRALKEGFFGARRHELVFWSGGVTTLAKTKAEPGWKRWGTHYVNLDAVEGEVVPRLRQAIQAEATELIVLDEVGQWQCLSESFRKQVVDCITSHKSV
ncbi:MAG: nucleoside-triphosphatase, partial [Acidimicrobiia bacterium]